jgi:deoxyribose-phosphate aldolase
MKYIDYACHDYSLNETEVSEFINSSIRFGITGISILPYSIGTIKNIPSIKEKKITISCPADYPHGLSDSKTRNFLVTQLCKSGVDHIDLVIPTKIVTNRKYDKFREDIRTNLEICRENNVDLRYILEYRVYSHEILSKICQILMDFGITTVFPSSGSMIDDISDNLIACNFLMTKSKINTICTGNMYHNKHANIIKNMDNLYGIRFFHLAGLAIFNDHIYFSK